MSRGYLGVFGPQIDEIARVYIGVLTEHYGDQSLRLKHDEYHITIASKPELQRLRAAGTISSSSPNSIPGLTQLNNDLPRPSSSPIVYGLGTNRKGVYWVTVAWAAGQRFRSQLTLPPKQFHITLTSVDEHGVDKVSTMAHELSYITPHNRFPQGPNSVIWVHPSYSFVGKILSQGNLDLVAPNQTEYLASFAYGLLAQNELVLAQSAAELLALSAPTNSRSFVCLGDIASQRGLWKLAMLSFGYALALHLGDSTSVDLKFDRISTYCLKQLRRSAEYTEWGAVFVITVLSNGDTANGEFGELPTNPTLRSYLCQPWSASLRQLLQTAYENIEPGRRPKRSLESRI
jgi:hypothetical protein